MKSRFDRYSPRRAALGAALGALMLAVPAAFADENPYAAFVKEQPTDVFNTRLSDAQKANPKPVRGGSIVRRMPSDFPEFNPVTSTTAEAIYALELVALDKLAKQDAEYYEFVPWICDWWSLQDTIDLESGETLVGLITEMEGDLVDPSKVVFAVGAQQLTVAWEDVDKDASDIEGGKLALRDGRSFEGKIIPYHYTVEIYTKGDADPEKIDIDDIKTLTYEDLGAERERKAVNKHCLQWWHFREKPAPTWHDGQPIVPQDAVLGYKTCVNPSVGAEHQQPYFEPVASMEAVEGNILRVELSKPYYRMFKTIAEMPILPSHALNYEAYEGDDGGYADYFNKNEMYLPGDAQMIGNGPYRRVSWKDNRMVLERYPDFWASKCDPPLAYWDPARPYIDRIEYLTITDNTAAQVELKKGDVTVDFDIEPSAWSSADTNTPEFLSRVVRAKNLTPSYTYIGWDLRKPLFQDRNVRQALTMLIPRQRIMDEVHYGLGRVQVADQFMEGPTHDQSLEPWPFDPEAAKKLLRKSRWLDRNNDGVLDHPEYGDFRFTYQIHTSREYHAKIADIIKEELGKANIDMIIDKAEWSVFIDRVRNKECDAFRFAWATDIDSDPTQSFHSSQAKPGGSNSGSYIDETADRLCEKIRMTFDFGERVKLYKELERHLYEDCPYTFMEAFEELFFYTPKYRNVKFYTLRPGYDFTEWYVDPEWKEE